MGLTSIFFKRLFGKAKGHQPDYFLIALIWIIIVFGLIILSSASSVDAYAEKGDSYYYFKHQLFGIIIGLFAFIFFAKTDYHVWKKYAFWFLLGSVILLLLVFIPGLSAAYGKSRSWINVFGYSLQPSELVKVSFLLYLAAWLEKRKGELKEIERGLGPFLATFGLIAFLMVLQPDIGTLSIIAFTSLIVYFIGGGRLRHIAVILIIGASILSILIQVNPYQKERLKCVMDPGYDPQGACYQINQSLIAVGSGGFFGRGFGASRQKFSYLPEVWSDSIFAVIGEETGLFLSLALLGLYLIIFYRGLSIARHAPDDFGKILAVGIVSWLAIQAIINVGGMINLFPMTGVPLPFISYGGSAILAALTAAGILVNISRQTRNR